MNLHLLVSSIPHLKEILETNEEVYLVGGTVRDFILGRDVKDFDIVVKGSGLEFARNLARRLRKKLIVLSEEEDQGRLVITKEVFIDVAGMRGENIEEDLKLRDFTINSLAVDLKSEILIDPLGGLEDIRAGLIRTLSKENLQADPLRILRAFRFKSELKFKIEKRTRKYIEELKDHLNSVAPERVHYELFLIFGGNMVAETVREMEEAGLLYTIFPELKPLKETWQKYYVEQNLMEHTLKVIEKLEENIKNLDKTEIKILKPYIEDFIEDDKKRALLLMGALFHDVAKPETIIVDEEGRTHFYGHEKSGALVADRIGERLRFSSKEREILKRLVRYHMDPHHLAGIELTRRAIYRYLKRTDELAFPLLLLAYSDAQATPPGNVLEGHRTLIERVIEFVEEEKKKKEKKRFITGYDLIDLGLKPGPIFKVILNHIEELEAEGTIKSKEEAIEEVLKFLKERGIELKKAQ